ncbi:MAG TPA: hypothetical protein VMW15_07740 [Terracidiphilus sp.]|nr:hypothetical protein [Terracidiphilus sp.]
MMDAMGRTREHLLHEAIRQAEDRERIAQHAIREMFRASDHCRRIERELERARIAFWFAAIVGGAGWLFAWALAAWGWLQ